MQRDRFGAGDETEERAGDRFELPAHRSAGVDIEQKIRHLILATRADRRDEQRFLVREMTVDRELGYAGFRGDRVHAGAFESRKGKEAFGRGEDGRAFFKVFRTTRTARLGDS